MDYPQLFFLKPWKEKEVCEIRIVCDKEEGQDKKKRYITHYEKYSMIYDIKGKKRRDMGQIVTKERMESKILKKKKEISLMESQRNDFYFKKI